MRKLSIFITLFAAFFVMSCSNVGAQKADSGPIDYTIYEKVLNTYVDGNGRVDYEGLIKNRGEFDQFIKIVENIDVTNFSEIEEKTFWINAYNAITLKVIIDKYPVKSIRKINFGLVWEVPRAVAGKKLSLGHIEHKILRPLGDPRIHFAINCASIGCPKLPNTAFYADKLDEQLEHESKRFINDPEKVRLDRGAGILYYSAIMDWFEKDFLVVEKDILGYIKGYINEEDLKFLNENPVKLKVLKYDWGLNKQ